MSTIPNNLLITCTCEASIRCKLVRRRGTATQGLLLNICNHYVYGKCAYKWAQHRQEKNAKAGKLPCGCSYQVSVKNLDRLAIDLTARFGPEAVQQAAATQAAAVAAAEEVMNRKNESPAEK